jgi:hypothetical protein
MEAHEGKQQRLFDKTAGCSDAESKVRLKLIGAPLWESRHVCTIELIDQDLDELGHRGRHP